MATVSTLFNSHPPLDLNQPELAPHPFINNNNNNNNNNNHHNRIPELFTSTQAKAQAATDNLNHAWLKLFTGGTPLAILLTPGKQEEHWTSPSPHHAFSSSGSYQHQRHFTHDVASVGQDAPDIRLIIMRHGERMDSKYGANWYNDPIALQDMYRFPTNRANPNEFALDPPLTLKGAHNAAHLGEMLAGPNNIKFHMCFCSPALRCIQTAYNVLLNQSQSPIVQICRDLYECFGWMGGPYQVPSFITVDEWKANGLKCSNPDEGESAFLDGSLMKPWRRMNVGNFLPSSSSSTSTTASDENEMSYYMRSARQIDKLVKIVERDSPSKSKKKGKGKKAKTINCLIVGHAPSAEVLTAPLLGSSPNIPLVRQMAQHINFLCMVIAERYNGHWVLNPHPMNGTTVRNVRKG